MNTDNTVNAVTDAAQTVGDKISNMTGGVEVKKLNIEIEKDNKTYKLDVSPDGAKIETN